MCGVCGDFLFMGRFHLSVTASPCHLPSRGGLFGVRLSLRGPQTAKRRPVAISGKSVPDGAALRLPRRRPYGLLLAMTRKRDGLPRRRPCGRLLAMTRKRDRLPRHWPCGRLLAMTRGENWLPPHRALSRGCTSPSRLRRATSPQGEVLGGAVVIARAANSKAAARGNLREVGS